MSDDELQRLNEDEAEDILHRAEVRALHDQIRAAYLEGFSDGECSSTEDTADRCWEESESAKRLAGGGKT